MHNDTKIIIIDDNYTPSTTLIVVLRDMYGDSNVFLFSNPNEGLDYVRNNLTQKMVLVVDMEFGKDEPSGVELLEEIRKQTSLVYIILITAYLGSMRHEDLIKCINNDAFAIFDKKAGYDTITSKVKEAVHQFDVRVVSALEQWVMNHPEEELEQPYLSVPPNRYLNMNQLLIEIRHQTDIGCDFERKIIYLAIDLLARRKKTV